MEWPSKPLVHDLVWARSVAVAVNRTEGVLTQEAPVARDPPLASTTRGAKTGAWVRTLLQAVGRTR